MKITNIIEELQKQEFRTGKYGNGNACKYQRMYINDSEFTLIDGYLYQSIKYFDGEKDTYSTVTRIKEGRREDNLTVNGYSTKFAPLLANRVISNDDFFNCCGLTEIET